MSGHNALQDMAVASFEMVDPGDTETIQIDRWGAVVPVVTVAAETRTLAQPLRAGLMATVLLATDGGTLTLTVTGGYDQAGSTTVTLDDVADYITFYSIKSGTSFYWRVIGYDGAIGPAVSLSSINMTGTTGNQEVRLTANLADALSFEDTTGDLLTLDTTTGAKCVRLPKGCMFQAGVKANTAGSGITIPSTDDWGAVRVFCDDNGASIAQSVRLIQGRMLCTYDQAAGSIRAVQGHMKFLTGIDCTTGVYTAVQGYTELAGTHNCKTGAVWSCFDSSLEITTSLTVDSGGMFYGVHVETTGAGTITNNGTCAAIGIDNASGAAAWPDGIFIDGASVLMGMRIGKFAGSAATTSAVVFSTGQDVYADGQLSVMEVHGASSSNLTSAYSAKCIRARHVVSGSSMTAAHETSGIMGQLVVKGTTLTHLHAGLIGTFEGHTSGVVVNSAYAHGACAVMARVGGGAAITATTDVSGVISFWNGDALASGASNAFALCDSGTVAWTNVISLSRATNLLDLPAAGTDPVIANALVPAAAPDAGTVGADACLRVLVNNVAYYIPLYDTLHA